MATLALGVGAVGFLAYTAYKAYFACTPRFCQPKLDYFDGKVVWITGASSGIGKELASQLVAKTSAKLILSSRRREVLEELKSELGKNDGVAVVPLDLDNHLSLEQAVSEAFSAFGGKIDILVNNAGISQRSLARMTSPDVYSKLMSIDYVGQIILTQLYVAQLVEAGASGHIVNVSSVAGKLPVPFRSGYCAAKAALNAYSDVLRMELQLEKYPVLVTVINPGGVKTDVSKNALNSEGKAFGTADAVTATGMEVEECVRLMLNGISNKLDDVIISSNLELTAVKLFSFLPLRLATRLMLPKYEKYLQDTLKKVK